MQNLFPVSTFSVICRFTATLALTWLYCGTVIGQDGEIPVVNACVNIAGVQTALGLACDPSTGDIDDGFERGAAPFGASGENPNQDSVSPN